MKFVSYGTSEILLRNMKYADAYEIFASQMLRGEFYFTFCESKIFHNPKDYFISHTDISLHTMLRIDFLPIGYYKKKP